jgi:hypothetical protein
MGATLRVTARQYCSISFKLTLDVMCDSKNHFDISTAAKIWRDTSEIFDIETKFLAFLSLAGNLEPFGSPV